MFEDLVCDQSRVWGWCRCSGRQPPLPQKRRRGNGHVPRSISGAAPLASHLTFSVTSPCSNRVTNILTATGRRDFPQTLRLCTIGNLLLLGRARRRCGVMPGNPLAQDDCLLSHRYLAILTVVIVLHPKFFLRLQAFHVSTCATLAPAQDAITTVCIHSLILTQKRLA